MGERQGERVREKSYVLDMVIPCLCIYIVLSVGVGYTTTLHYEKKLD